MHKNKCAAIKRQRERRSRASGEFRCRWLILKLVSAEGIESAKKRSFNNIQGDR